MKRRTALQCLTAAIPALLPAISAKGETSAKRPEWKTAVGLNGFASSSQKYKKSYPIWEILDFLSRAGFDGVELEQNWPMGGYPKPNETARINALRRMYDGFGLKIFSIQTSADGAFSPDENERKAWLANFRDQAEFAKLAGCECIGTWPGGGLRGQTIDTAIARLAESFNQAGNIVKELGLLLSFEIEPPFVFNTEEILQKILKQITCPSVKTMFDSSHFDLMNGSKGKPYEMLQRIGVENIGYLHLTDTDGTLRDGGTSKHLPCGDGHADIPQCLKILREKGFKGWIMIDAWEIPDVYDAAQKGITMIKTAMK